MTDCIMCDVAAGRRAPPAGAIARAGGFMVFGSLDATPNPGWVLVVPEKHVEAWDALAPAEAEALGALVRRAMAAVRAVTGAPKIYVNVFGEMVPHLHVHLFPRAADVPPERGRGARLLVNGPPPASPEAADAAARAIIGRLSTSPPDA